jgi:hypothetical protein
MSKIRSFSGEFPRKMLFPEPLSEELSFEDRLISSVGDSVGTKIKGILLCLLDSEFPYKEIGSAVQALERFIEEEKIQKWKPKIWYEIHPGKFIIGEDVWGTWGSPKDYEEEQ